jgi:lysine-specific demethylase 8
MQVAGYKYIRLYAADQTPYLYQQQAQPGGGGLGAQGNLSAVEIASPDMETHPLFAKAVYTETVLGPGEMLFIPAKCWHYVRSLSTSFSVSFWF